MSVATPRAATAPTPPPTDDLAAAPAKALWRSEAPDAVRKAWKRDDHNAAWTAWVGWLDEREAVDPLAEIATRGLSPLAWGATDADREGLDRLLDARVSPSVIAEWVDAAATRPADVGFALECVALADAAPTLAARLDPPVWWRLCSTLLGLAVDAAAGQPSDTPTAEDAAAQQLLAGELPLALAAALPELKPMHRLRSDAAAALGDGVVRLSDGEGLPHAGLLPRLPALAACWARCRARAAALGKRPWPAAAETQFEWLVRQLLRLVDRDGRPALAASAPAGMAPLLAALLDQAGDDDDLAAAAARLKGFKAAGDGDPPEPAVHSEWAGLSVLACGWSDKAPRLTATHAGRTMEVELRVDRRTLVRGEWPISVRLDGRDLAAADDWEVACWYSDEDCDYLELAIDLVGGARLERQLFLARNDGVAMLSEILVTGRGEPAPAAVATRLPLAEGVALRPDKETREAALAVDGRDAAGVFPLSLPEWRIEPGCGSMEQRGGELRYDVERDARNLAATLWLDLAPKRFGKQRTWRQLTIAASLERVGPDTAVGYRVQSGPDQWIAYRSLDPPANRTLLGYNLSSETLVGRFLKTGEVDEYFEIDDED